MSDFTIREDDLTGSEIIELLTHHLDDMHSHTPAESVHAMAVTRLAEPDITFWSIWDETRLAGCGALKQIDPIHGEIKSMRTVDDFRGRGVAGALVAHMIDAAWARGYHRVSLETGTNEPFAAARRLYTRHGFVECAPFADYVEDPWSVFMTLERP